MVQTPQMKVSVPQDLCKHSGEAIGYLDVLLAPIMPHGPPTPSHPVSHPEGGLGSLAQMLPMPVSAPIRKVGRPQIYPSASLPVLD